MIFGSTIFGCYPLDLFVANIALASVEGFLAFIAFYQLTRIHMRNQLVGWTRQKVLHLIIGSSNLGYSIYFISTVLATCERWFCWSHACGFVLMASPNILLLAAFLLLLSFWVDLCHQANDEEDDDEESSTQQALLDNSKSKPGVSNIHDRWRCCPLKGIHVGSRQKIVIVVVMLMFILMISFAMIIWIGAGKNPIDSSLFAQVYVDIFAAAVLLLGGALGCYGLLLFCKLRRVRSERTSSEMRKVAGLAVVSVICFSSSALIAFLTDIPFSYHWNLKKMNGVGAPVLLILYYFIGYLLALMFQLAAYYGSSVPSAFLLWVMRELPPPVAVNCEEQSRVIAFISCGSERMENPGYWATAASLKNQVSRASPI
ncbi:tobamovirus multiplication protein 1 isoform X1 [Pistacia vera]|uniref:tobamovirus multiplication protein 1 isoform X1 n=1 Tax=Pistacia vera TaxID=55513 RepID=UPI00126378ED|nr:tobamovirus multiplication protein 1 isoform X1 [Pistacia vera]